MADEPLPATGVAGGAPAAVLAGLLRRLARHVDADVPAWLRLGQVGPAPDGDDQVGSLLEAAGGAEPVAGRGPALLGAAHQLLLGRAHRRRRGVFYTDGSVAGRLTEVVLSGLGSGVPGPWHVCDPAAGGGSFLLALADGLADRGVPARQVVEEQVWGADIDPLAAAVAEAALWLWSVERGDPASSTRVACGDTLLDGATVWPGGAPGFTAVVGNPPFQNQLGAGTARSPADTERLREALGSAAVGYADTSTLFLVRALQLAAPAGRVALILPQSFLGARDAARARAEARRTAVLVGLWWCDEPVFDAEVRVCAPLLERRRSGDGEPDRGDDPPVARYRGPEVAEAAPAPPLAGGDPGAGWSPLVADLRGVPAVLIPPGPSLSSIARATAGFRDQYYGIAALVSEAPTERADASPAGDSAGYRATSSPAPAQTVPERLAPLVTSGLIDPGRCLWGSRTTRFAGRAWRRPTVPLDQLDGALARWAGDVVRPKVVLATQTRVLEAAVDRDGRWWPSVPVIAVVPDDPGMLDRVAAVLLAPPVSAWACAHHGGSALSADAVKLAARQVEDIPLPAIVEPWEEAAALVEAIGRADDAATWRAGLDALGRLMCDAYGLAPAGRDALMHWWLARLPAFRDDPAKVTGP